MQKLPRLFFGFANLGVAGLLSWGVFRGLPNRWWIVDGGAAIVATLLASSGLLLVGDHRRARELTRVAAAVTLAMGLALVAALAMTASFLAGTYGPVGRGGAAIFGLVCALAVPYVVVLPAIELVWVGPRKKAS